jgi:hypothetical protein
MVNNALKEPKKRPYVKKTLITQDELWKLIIPTIWSPLIHFCMEDWVDKIDFSRKPIFLDKELKRLQPLGKSKNRAVDVLMRVFMKDGAGKKFLLHLEIQAYFDKHFPYRVYQYHYRISDNFQEPIETLVILIDEDPHYRPNHFSQVFGQTELHFKFRLFKLLDNPPPYLGKENNPFSIVLEVAWYALKQNKLKSDEDLMALKYHLIKRLKEQNIENKVIYALLDFINIYLPFKNSEKAHTFEQNIESLVFKDIDMEATTIRDLYIKRVREQEQKFAQKEIDSIKQEEARKRQEEARMRQEAEKKMVAAIINCSKQGLSAEQIANLLLQPLDVINEVIKNNA